MNNYRKAFWIVLVMNLMLIAGLGFLWWRYRSARTNSSAVTMSPETFASEAGSATNAAPVEEQLVPIQLSPQRLRSIGVSTGVVEMKSIHDEIRATGNVEVDEERLAYVQVRFPGWIQQVFA